MHYTEQYDEQCRLGDEDITLGRPIDMYDPLGTSGIQVRTIKQRFGAVQHVQDALPITPLPLCWCFLLLWPVHSWS